MVVLAESEIIDIALKLGLKVARETFADRAYNSDSLLVKRSIAGVVISDPDIIAKRVIKMIDQQKAETIDGKTIDLATLVFKGKMIPGYRCKNCVAVFYDWGTKNMFPR